MSNKQDSPRPVGGGPNAALFAGKQKPKNFSLTFRKLMKYMSPFMWGLILSLILISIGAVLLIVNPRFIGDMVNQYQSFITSKDSDKSKYFDKIVNYSIIIGSCMLGYFVLTAIAQNILVRVSQKTIYRFRRDLDIKFSNLPLKFFDGRTKGEVLSRVTNDVETIGTTLQQSMSQIISSVTMFFGSLIMMLITNVTLTLVTISVLPLYFVVAIFLSKKSQKHFKGQQVNLGKINGLVEEMYSGHQLVKAYNYENIAIEKFKVINEDLAHSSRFANYISGLMFPVMNFITNFGFILITIAAVLILKNEAVPGASIGLVATFAIYSRQFTQPILQIAQTSTIIQSTIAAAERVFEVLDEEEESKDSKETVELKNCKGKISFKNVEFGYAADKMIIDNFSLEVNPGDKVAIVGPTGAGKTTLVNLLMRFYDINNGDILIDDISISKMKRNDIRQKIGMVLQDTWLFKGTIMENIRYGNLNATDEEVYEAAKTACIDNYIQTLPDGYNTILNEDASNISQGQKQLLTIARVIIANPSMLILDEATSNVDTRTEVLIQEAMNKLMSNRTSFIIAHRLSTIKTAKMIIVMNKGNVIEKGDHNELMMQKGFYFNLYNSQFSEEAA